MYRTYYTILFMLFLACSKDAVAPPCKNVGDCQEQRDETGEWSFDLGDGQYLVNSPGLTEMALTGSHRLLGQELNGTTGRRIPNGLNDTYEDNPHEGYASQRVYGNYIVAMYHPRRWAPDHFITFNWKSGDWIRWDLSEGPGIVNQSD